MKLSGKSSLVIQLVFFSVLALTIIIVWIFNPPKFLGETLSASFHSKTGGGFTAFSDSQNIEIKKYVSGYWQRYVPPVIPDKPYSITDRIELKENGIFWQVKKLVVYTPNGDSTSCTEIVTGYINPFKHHDEDSTLIIVDALIHGKAFATEQDTCYVSGLSNSIANQRRIISMTAETFASTLKRDADLLFIDNHEYILYDTIQHTLAEFFPRGAVEIVDKISTLQCKSAMSSSFFVKQRLADYFTSVKPSNSDTGAARLIIDRYYYPLIAKEISQHYTTGFLKPLEGHLSVMISINPDGTVKEVKKKSIRVRNQSFVMHLTEEIAGWRFVRLDGDTSMRNVYYTFNF
jgi:hypothetical protein